MSSIPLSASLLRQCAASLLLLGSTASFAQTTAPGPATPASDAAGDEPVQLSPFTVNTVGDKGYGTSAGLGGTRINQPLIDSSMSIANLNKEFLEDLGFTQLSDQVQFVSGMSSTGAQADGRYATRGRYSSGSNFRDGMPEAFGVNSTEQVDSSLFDRIEVIKGPAGVLFGSMDIGGTVNRISKRPLPKNTTTIAVSYNTLGTIRTDFDSNRILRSTKNGKLALRVAGVWQDGQSDDGSLDNRRAFNPSLQYTSTSGETLWLYFIFQNVASGTRDTTPGDKNGNPFPYIEPGYKLYAGTSPRWDNRRISEAGYTRKINFLGAESAFRVVARYLCNDQDRANSANGAYTVYDTAGKSLGSNAALLWSNVTVGRLDWGGLIKSEQWVAIRGGSLNADYSSKFKLFGGTHSLFVYGEGVQSKTTNYILQSGVRPPAVPRWPVFQLPPAWESYLWNPIAKTVVNGDTVANSSTQAAATQDSVSYWNNHLILTGGARYDHGEIKSQNRLTAGAPVVTSKIANWSGKYGLVVKPLRADGFALFYNHSDTFVPVTSVDSSKSSPTYGKKFPNQIGLSNEVGTKVDLFNSRVVGSLVYYSSALTNQLLTVVASDGSNIQQPIGKVNSRGWEFDLATKVSSRLTLLTSWSELRARTLAGLPLRGNPQRTIAVLGKYSFQHPFLRGLSIVAGGRYAAERAGDNNATFYTPDLEVYNLNVIYTRKDWRAQINVDNLMNSRQVTGSVDVSRLDLYNKRNVTFKIGRTF